MPLFGKKSSPLPPLEDLWSISQGEQEGHPMFVRFNTGLHPAVGHPDYGTRIGIAIPLHDADACGFPSEPEMAQLALIEDRLFETYRRDGYGLPAIAITTNSVREYVMYVREAKGAEERLIEVSADIASHGFQLIIQRDKSWNVYRQFSGA